ncbi:MAG TPA: DUF1998 domain-containing protein [Conexibacter sp.]|jgi:hypothetical protein|nr:DUF1998 domain-containing protein [Conexibacter sp.]
MTQRPRTIRLSQTIAPFGVGAIYDYRGESLIACDTSRWRNAGERLDLERLAQALRVEGFRSAPTMSSRHARSRPLPFIRFPRWLFCASCRVMVHWTDRDEVTGQPARCGVCRHRPQLVPMRFVMTCAAGHLGDVPWERWAHLGAKGERQKSCRSRRLEFLTDASAGTGLAGLTVRCRECGAVRSLSGITGSGRQLGVACVGKQPWVYTDTDTPSGCDQQPVIVQRGASNLYFADVRSAIDIPPGSDHDPFGDLVALVTNTIGYDVLASSDDEEAIAAVYPLVANSAGVSEETVRAVVASEVGATDGRPVGRTPTGDLRRDEWAALLDPRPQRERDRFRTRRVPLVEGGKDGITSLLQSRLEDPVLVTRLREVRALIGFRRYDTAGQPTTPHLDDPSIRWLPAIEVYGEGVFLPFAEDRLQEWEVRAEVRERAARLESRRADSLIAERVARASARFVMLHTFAHLLIRQLAFESGYAAASLRERIYCAAPDDGSEPYAGVLVYTAAGDAEGTLGGLVRQGRAPRMVRTIVSMLETAAWCSSDPICIESGGQGFQSLNLGACHACSLLSETSCEYSNSLLDRGLLFGERAGFFTPVLDAALQAAAENR